MNYKVADAGNPIMKAYQALDYHLQGCQRTRLVQKEGAPDRKESDPCTLMGDKCPKGMSLWTTWLKAIGVNANERLAERVTP